MVSYPTYKSSGIDWIGDIPEHWKSSKLKYDVELIMGQSPDSENYNDEGIGTPFLQGNTEFGEKYPTNTKWTTQITKVCHENDLLYSVRGSLGEMNWSNKEYCIGRGLCGLRPYNLERRFCFYLLLTLNEEIKSLGVGSTFLSISTDDIKNLFYFTPPLSEQIQIVKYLDEKTELIDKLISTKERKIILLKEQRTSLINEVITKGLNPDVKMKDSGVEWIGEIPEGWKYLPIKYTLINNKESIRTGPFGSSLKSDEFLDEGIRVYNQRSVYDEDFSKSDIFISEEKFEELKSFIVLPGDILITSRGTIGRMTIVPSDGEIGVLHPCLIRLRLNIELLIPKYLWWYINHSSLFINSVKIESNSTTIEVIYSETLSSIRIPIPTYQEQHQIIQFFDSKTKEIDDMVHLEQKKINLLKEYRQSLISEVITGKISIIK